MITSISTPEESLPRTDYDVNTGTWAEERGLSSPQNFSQGTGSRWHRQTVLQHPTDAVPVTVFIPEVLQVINPDDYAGGGRDYYVTVKIGGNSNTPHRRMTSRAAHFYPNWIFTDYVDPAAAPIKIKIELWDSDLNPDDHVDINPGGAPPSC
jgi:hypothetical protein